MKNDLSVTESEWVVLEAIWDRHPITSREIVELLKKSHGWKLGTVNTFLHRLNKKGAVNVEKQGNANVYSPKVSREECVRQHGESFLKRVFRGAPTQALCHFLEESEFSEDDLDHIEKLIQQKRQNKPARKKGKTRGDCS